MKDSLPMSGRVSVLALDIHNHDDPDRPVVHIGVDGEDPFATVVPGWAGFDPDDVLGGDSPLLPTANGRRVALYRCSCGEAGCGSIAPLVVASPDGRHVHWVDFRDFVGVFFRPLAAPVEDGDDWQGRPVPVPDLRFDLGQYVQEIGRASADLSWETPRRRTARLLRERLAPLRPVLPPDLRLGWVVPAWDGPGVALSFERDDPYRQVVLRLASRHEDPEPAAGEMADRLLASPPTDWARTFRLE